MAQDLSKDPVKFLTSARVLGRPGEITIGYGTELSLNSGCEDWPVPADQPETTLNGRHYATLRRVGWLDQKGRVWTRTPATAEFDGGSLTPLLIDARGD